MRPRVVGVPTCHSDVCSRTHCAMAAPAAAPSETLRKSAPGTSPSDTDGLAAHADQASARTLLPMWDTLLRASGFLTSTPRTILLVSIPDASIFCPDFDIALPSSVEGVGG